MKESQLKQLVKAVLTQLHENNNPEAWRKHEFPSGEPPEPLDAEEGPDVEPLTDRIASLEDTLAKLELADQKAESGTPESREIYIKMMKVLNALIDLYSQQEQGVTEAFGMAHDVVSPQDANTMNKSTIK